MDGVGRTGGFLVGPVEDYLVVERSGWASCREPTSVNRPLTAPMRRRSLPHKQGPTLLHFFWSNNLNPTFAVIRDQVHGLLLVPYGSLLAGGALSVGYVSAAEGRSQAG